MAGWKWDGSIASGSLPDDGPLDWLIHDGVESIVDAGYKLAADHPAISTALAGASSIHHLEGNFRALENPTLPEADKQRLRVVSGDISIYISAIPHVGCPRHRRC